MSVRHAAGTVFKAFAAHVAVFFMRMADFAPAVLRVTRNVVTVMMVLMFFTTAGIVFMPFMNMSFAAAARFVMAVLVFRLMAVPMPALVTVFMVMVTTATSPIFMVMVMRAHFITAVSYIR